MNSSFAKATTASYALLESADRGIASAWSVVVDWSGGEDGDYFRLCILPTLASIFLFWLLNVPLLFFNFVPSLNPLEKWKIQKGRYETKERVCSMVRWLVSMTSGLQPRPAHNLCLCRTHHIPELIRSKARVRSSHWCCSTKR